MQTSMPIRLMMNVAVIGILGTGCTVPTEPSSDPRVTQLEYDDMSFRATVERGASRVTIAVQRTGPRVEGFIRDPEIDSPYESDVVVRNRYDFPFLRGFGGDAPSEDLEGSDSTEPPTDVNQEHQLEDLQLVVDAAEALRDNPEIGEEFRWELRDIQNMAAGALRHANDGLDGLIHPELTPGTEEIQSESNGPISVISSGTEGEPLRSSHGDVSATEVYLGTTYNHVAYITWANFIWPFGHHSALWLFVYDANWNFLTAVSTRNHGREASDPSMATVSGCPGAWGGRSNYLPPLQPHIGSDTYNTGDAGGCGTSYGLGSGDHVCNDDSLAEYWHVKYNAASSWVTCGDSTLRAYAPSCN
jgi:hypothetical protein